MRLPVSTCINILINADSGLFLIDVWFLKEYLEVARSYPSCQGLRENLSALDVQSTDISSIGSKISCLKPSISDSSMDQEGRDMRQIVQCLAEHVIYGQDNLCVTCQ